MHINNFTHVTHPERGPIELAPGEIPAWAESLITNPALIVTEESEDDSTEESEEQDETTGTETGTEESEGNDTEESEDDSTEEVEIPKKGSSAKKWAEYALSKGFKVESDATAANIREDLEAEGIPTE